METIIQTVEMQEISESYDIIKELGQGSYGRVLLAQDKLIGQPLAMKLVGIPEDAVKRCAIQISCALDYMHRRGLVHRDLKTDNVLLMDRDCYYIKLSDFGLTQRVGTCVSAMSHIIPYMAPELCALTHEEFLILSSSIDTWAFGVLLFVILTGYLPWFEALKTDALYQEYTDWKQCSDFTPSVRWKILSREAMSMLGNFFAHSPCCRHPVHSVSSYLDVPWKIKISAHGSHMADGEEETEINVVDS
ncbi:serine/threonine-protein kinase SBK1-like [Anomaloglossus baeobatrachus]